MWKMSSSLSVQDPTSKRSFWAFLGASNHTADSFKAWLIRAFESKYIMVSHDSTYPSMQCMTCSGVWWCIRGSEASTREFHTALCAQTSISLPRVCLGVYWFWGLGVQSLGFRLYDMFSLAAKQASGAESQQVSTKRESQGPQHPEC